MVNLVRKLKITRKKVDIIFYSQSRIEASKAPGDSGCAQGCLVIGGRPETQAQVDLITTLVYGGRNHGLALWEPVTFCHSLHLTPGQLSFQSVLLSQMVPAGKVRGRAIHTALLESVPEGAHSGNEAAGLTSVSLFFRNPGSLHCASVAKTNLQTLPSHVPY